MNLLKKQVTDLQVIGLQVIGLQTTSQKIEFVLTCDLRPVDLCQLLMCHRINHNINAHRIGFGG